jgi:DNA helicase-2/ATP-dependent DNA helicase PcrA
MSVTTSNSVILEKERRRLEEVLRFILYEISRLRAMSPANAAHQQTANLIQQQNDETIVRLQKAHSKPYHGRIDFRAESTQEASTYYIGKYFVPGHVYNWENPIAALYYRPTLDGYEAHGRFIPGKVELKREIVIENAHLLRIADIYRLPEPHRPQSLTINSVALSRVLSAPSEGDLQEIIETIQPEQYEQIAAIAQPVLIIQGAAGSGKSLVGLHRLAYLLSPFNELSEELRPRANRVLMLGPTRAFLDYARNLLPSLTGQEIKQTTVQAWLLEAFSETPRFDRNNKLFAALMNNVGKISREEYEAETVKGSLLMGSVLERYAKTLWDNVLDSATAIEVHSPDGTHLAISPAQVVRFAHSVSDTPLNRGRVLVANRIIQELVSLTTMKNATQDFENAARQQVDTQLSRFWPATDFREAYLRLLSSPALMKTLSRGVLTPEVTSTLAESVPAGGEPFRETDLAPLLYLDQLLNERPSQLLEHVVIDEAQDISPLEVALLKRHSRNGWFTILGDVRQRLLPYRGINNWRQLSDVFDRVDVARYETRLSYRSTSEITRFANRLLRRLPGTLAPPIPYQRRGKPVRFCEAHTMEEMASNIADEIRGASERPDIRSIAVLTKWTRGAKSVARQLEQHGIADVILLEASGTIQRNVTIAPVLLTKGLEFDLVIVASVNGDKFTATEFDDRLLYLACTRAKHLLPLHWFGKPAQTLREVGAIRISQARDRS